MEANAEPVTKTCGYYLDPLTEYSGAVKRTRSMTVAAAVGMVSRKIIGRLNKVHSFDPPLAMTDMEFYYGDLNLRSSLHDIDDDDGLDVRISPKVEAVSRIRRHFHNLKRTEEKTNEVIQFMQVPHNEDAGAAGDTDEEDIEEETDEETDSDTDTDEESDNTNALLDVFKLMRKDTARLTKSLHQQQAERKEETTRFNRLLRQMNNSLLQEKEERKEETTRLNSSLRQEQEARKEETTLLNNSLRQEKEERKADSASHKLETSRLNRSLLLEEEKRKAENRSLMDQTKSLKENIRKEQEERMEVVADLEGTIERQGAELQECEIKLRNAKEQHDSDMRDISELTCKLIPIHLRILLDSSRKIILQCVNPGLRTWEDFRRGKKTNEMRNIIKERLRSSGNLIPLSTGTVDFLCAYNNMRQLAGNDVAHNATQEEIHNAVVSVKGSWDARHLEELYGFVYPTAL